MSDEQAQAMLAELREHYREPVLPLSRFCEATTTWMRCVENGEAREDYAEHLRSIEMDIRKSSLLYRMLYEGEKPRHRKCPLHKGRWSGINVCPHGCGSTGWIPDDWPDSAPRCTDHPDEPAVSQEVSVGGARNNCWDCHSRRWLAFTPPEAPERGADD